MLILLAAATFVIFAADAGVDGLTCYSCAYSDNPGLVGYQCVTSPADYVLGPSTTQCNTACSATTQKFSGSSNIWYMTRGCQTESDGCSSSGGIDKCVESCTSDLCNNKSYGPAPQPSTTPVSTTTTTEVPGTISCYSCVLSYHPDGDTRCITDPANVPPPSVVRCPPNRHCSTFRQWSKGQNVVWSFRRGCDPIGKDGCLEDTYFITCNWYCQTEFCNYGDGTAPTHRNNKEV